MAHESSPDEPLVTLAAARPVPPADVLSPDSIEARAMLDSLLAAHQRGAGTRRRYGVAALGAVAAIVLAVVVTATLLPSGDGPDDAPAPSVAAPAVLGADEIRHIADVSTSRLGGTGRAQATFVMDEGSIAEQRGTVDLAFAGDDLEMLIHMEGRDGRPGFDAANRTVDGEFYLLDGPPESKRWYHDTNASGTRGSDLFSLDPRTLLGVLQPGAAFTEVGTEEIDGVAVRHLRATELDELPAFNTSLGPIDPASVVGLDVWADGDGVVRRLDVRTHRVEEVPAGPLTATIVDENGRKTKVTVVDPAAGMVTRESKSAYSVRFHDLGAPITITAPEDAIPVAGQG